MKKKEVAGIFCLIIAVLILAAVLSYELTLGKRYAFLINFITAALIMVGIALLEVWYVIKN